MKISLNWLRDFVEIPADTDARALAQLFTQRTAEVEGVENQSEDFKNMVVGRIEEIHPHPNADKLRITKTCVGKETLQIICGASNIHEGQYVPVAKIGAKVRWHGQGDLITLEAAKLRGVDSFGMICAGDEIGLEEKSEGIYDLSSLKPKAGTPLAEALEKDDVIFHVDNKSLTHRPDLWGHYGIAREVAAITGKKLKAIKPKAVFPTKGTGVKVDVKDAKLCPRYIGVLMENIKIEESPIWLQRRLKAAGYRPINNIVDATNYVMAELGQPMHAFDADKIKKGIVVRKAKEDEQIVTLDGTARKLPAGTLVIADHEKPVAIAGIMGGADSEISANTTSIILESATFDPASIRKSSTKIGLRTEAVQRFEKSLDPNLAELAMDRLIELIKKIAPSAVISGPATDIKNFDPKLLTVTVDPEKICSKIGKQIKVAEMVKILNSLEFKTERLKSKKLKVQIPSFRATKDISMEDDIVEEIARLHGYENIGSTIPSLPTKLPMENIERAVKHNARQILSWALGFSEVYNYSFYNLKDINNSLLPEELHLQVENYLSEDQTHMRVSLVPNMLKDVAHNLKYRPEFKLYEIGRTYEDLQEYFPIEKKNICAMIVQDKSSKTEVFYQAKGALESFIKQMQIHGLTMRKGESFRPYAHPNKYAEYYLKDTGEVIARVFELHPLVAKNNGLENAKIGIFEIDFTALVPLKKFQPEYRPIPKFPGISFDVSATFPRDKEVGKIQRLIADCDRTLIKEVKLFDIYEGPNIPEGKKALAFKIALQAEDRTLTDAEMKVIQQKIFETLTKSHGTIRGR